jgi:hypothetical protein
MSSPYMQAFGSYFIRMRASWLAVLIVIGGLAGIIGTLAAPNAMLHGGSSPFLLGLGFVGWPMWLQFRQQLADPRRTVMPGFLTPHLTAFITLALSLAVAWPLAVTFEAGLGSVGLLAAALLFFAFLGWFMLTLSQPLVIAGAVGWFWFIIEADSDPLRDFLTGKHETIAVGLLIAALIAVVETVVRFCRMREDDPFYARNILTDSARLRPRATGEINQRWQTEMARGLHNWGRPQRLVMPASGRLWARARAWSSLHGGLTGPMLVGTLLLLSRALMSRFPPPMVPMGQGILMVWVLIMPTLAVSAMWQQMWRFLEGEFLRPIERAAFFKEIGLAMMINVAQWWSILAAAMIADELLIGAGLAGVVRLAALLSATLAGQVFGFGVAIWLMRYRSPVLVAILLMIPLTTASGAFTLFDIGRKQSTDFHRTVLVAMFALGGLGILITRDAWRRWLKTELG